MKRALIILALLVGGCLAAFGQEFERKTFTAEDGTELNYRLLRPSETAKAKKFPLIIFLHGLGERGTDNQKQLTWGRTDVPKPCKPGKISCICVVPAVPRDSILGIQEHPGFIHRPEGGRTDAGTVQGSEGDD